MSTMHCMLLRVAYSLFQKEVKVRVIVVNRVVMMFIVFSGYGVESTAPFPIAMVATHCPILRIDNFGKCHLQCCQFLPSWPMQPHLQLQRGLLQGHLRSLTDILWVFWSPSFIFPLTFGWLLNRLMLVLPIHSPSSGSG